MLAIGKNCKYNSEYRRKHFFVYCNFLRKVYVDCFVEMVYIKVHIVLINVNMLSAMSLEHIRLTNINDSTDMTHCLCELVHNQLNIKLGK